MSECKTTQFSTVAKQLIDVYKATFKMVSSDIFRWAAESNSVFYDEKRLDTKQGLNSLMHEIGHGLLNHRNFELDIDLINMEKSAWQKTKELSDEYSSPYDQEYAESCLESYRTWLHERAKCPNCDQVSLEESPQQYACFNCFTKWRVSKDQLCQIQRRRLATA